MPNRPKAPALVQGRDYFCGECVGRGTVPCDYCVDGCPECGGSGLAACTSCQGGDVPVRAPDWL